MVGYLEANWFAKAWITILTSINSMVYGLVKSIFQVFMNLVNTTMFNETIIETFTQRIYVVLGIYMLFKLAFSLLSSIVDPNTLLDKEKGMGKIVTRTIIALMMLVFVPYVFEFALEWQDNIAVAVPKVIIGNSVGSDSETMAKRGEELAAVALKAFFEINPECGDANAETELAQNNLSVESTLDLAHKICPDSGKTKVFRYMFNGVVSLVVGIVMVIMIAGYCIDVAIRVIKIGILRIAAPIPIISYIDPKSEKNGAFGNWLKECISTYVEVFIKLIILYFVVYILSGIATDEGTFFNFPEGSGAFVKLFLIIGAFFFMGKASDFICNILGVKKPESSGGLFKGLAGLGAALGIGAAGISGAMTNYRDAYKSAEARGKPLTGLSKGKAIASAILGGGLGVAAGAKAVAGTKTGKMGAALSAAYKRNTAHTQAATGGASLTGEAGAYIQRMFTGQTSAEQLEREVSQLDTQAKSIDALVNHADNKAKTSKDTIGYSAIKDANGRVVKSVEGNYQAWTHAFSAAKSQGLTSFEFNNKMYTMQEAESLDYGLFTSNSECYIRNQGFGDVVFKDLIIDYEQNNPEKPIEQTTTRKEVKDLSDKVNSQKNAKNRELRTAKANSDAVKPK